MRRAEIKRKTNETDITVELNIDGSGRAEALSGIGFFDHMLDHIARHGMLDLVVQAKGDLHVDAHHTVEDVGICLGKAFAEALGNLSGVRRYGHAVVPMDEALAEVAIDFSGRPFLAFEGGLPRGMVGDFDAELTEEFLRAFSVHARATVHVILRTGSNLHHCIEAVFKAFGRALDEAAMLDDRRKDVPSTKGTLNA